VAHGPLTQEYLYFAMSAGVRELRSQAGGAVFDAIIRDTFRFISVMEPSEGIVERFTEIIRPYLNSIKNLQAQIRVLRETRDILLPRLMSGEVEV
jgi:type I restriction enzyme S subunit